MAFDFDGTITTQGHLPLFLTRLRGPGDLASASFGMPPDWAGAAGWRRPGRGQAAICMEVLGGLDRGQAEAAAARRPRVVRASFIRADTEARIKWHLAQGHRIIVVSASFEAYVAQVAAALGIDEVIATRGRSTPKRHPDRRLDGPTSGARPRSRCWRTTSAVVASSPMPTGTVRGDTAMLARAEHPVRVGRRRIPPLAPPPVDGARPDPAPGSGPVGLHL